MATPDHRLEPLKKSDLQFEYPLSANRGDDPSKRGEPDRSLLNRSEWYEMLYFCNRFTNTYGKGDRGIALKTERLIKRDHVPSNLHSHEHIEQWLLKNWKMYPTV